MSCFFTKKYNRKTVHFFVISVFPGFGLECPADAHHLALAGYGRECPADARGIWARGSSGRLQESPYAVLWTLFVSVVCVLEAFGFR